MEAQKKKEIWRVVKYTLFAASAGVIQIGTFTLLNEVAKLEYWLSYFIGLALSVIWNFTFITFFNRETLVLSPQKDALFVKM